MKTEQRTFENLNAEDFEDKELYEKCKKNLQKVSTANLSESGKQHPFFPPFLFAPLEIMPSLFARFFASDCLRAT